MALRHQVPAFQPVVGPRVGEATPIPRKRGPVSVGFRSGADLEDVVVAVTTSPVVSVDAAVGAGKTVRLPYELAAAMGKLVVHIFPSLHLAYDVSQYTASLGRPVVFVDDVETDFPESGVVCMSASTLVARWLTAGEACLPECVLYHDESHESDAYTYVVKMLAPCIRTVSSYVSATATATGGGFRAPETDGKLIKKLYPANQADSSTWSFDKDDEMWSPAMIEDHLLVFEDNKERASRLVHEYRMNGFEAFRLHSRMSVGEFSVAMSAVRDPRSPVVVLVADYSFRSGFTFPVSCIIDTGIVQNVEVVDGKAVRTTRAAFALERYQAAGRGGRIKGLSTVYYEPEREAPMAICDLESVEAEAVALILRLLGKVLPAPFSKAVLANGKVPRNLHQALKGATPLAVMQPMQMITFDEFFSHGGRRSPFLKADVEISPMPLDARDPRVSADTARKVGMAGMTRTNPMGEFLQKMEDDYGDYDESYDSAVGMSPEPLKPATRDSVQDYSMGAVTDALTAMASIRDEVDRMQIGAYYHASGIHSEDVRCMQFPDGADSVCKILSRDKSSSVQFYWSNYNRSVAVNALLTRYNVRTCEYNALSRAIVSARSRAVGKDIGALRSWGEEVGQRIVTVCAELRQVADYTMRIIEDYCGLVEAQPMREVEEQLLTSIMRNIDELPSSVALHPGPMMSEFRRQVGTVPQGFVTGGSVSSGSDEGGGTGLDRIPMSFSGRGMRAVAPSHRSLALGAPKVKVTTEKWNGKSSYVRRKIT